MTSAARIGLIGDIHAEHVRLEAVLAYLRGRVDVIAGVGDIVDGDGDVDRCCELLQKSEAVVVRGNHDRWFTSGESYAGPEATPQDTVKSETRRYLASLLETVRIATVAGDALLCHGLHTNDMKGVWSDEDIPYVRDEPAWQRIVDDPSIRIVLNGHTHRRAVHVIDGVTVVNAGTLRTGDEPGFALLDLANNAVNYFDVTRDGAIAPAESMRVAPDPLGNRR